MVDKIMQRRNKRGQMVIWAIIAVAIVAIIIFVFFLRVKSQSNISSTTNPQLFIEKCTRDAVLEAVEKMMPQGGFIEPKNYVIYKNGEIAYLCQNIGNYYPCINQHPSLFSEEKLEIKNYILPRIESCFSQLKSEAAKRNEEVKLGDMELRVEMAPRRILVNIDRETIITRNEESSKFDSYGIEIESPLYDLSNVANDIATSQANFCYFEYAGYEILYPRFMIEVFTLSDSTKIYTIKDKETGEKFNTAIRGCAIPAGI
jgi:hypothetical protein